MKAMQVSDDDNDYLVLYAGETVVSHGEYVVSDISVNVGDMR